MVAALGEPVQRVGPRWIATISLANLALWMGYFGPLQVLLPEQVAQVAPGGKEAAPAWVTGLGAAVTMISNPIAGALSDRTTSRYGRRHPWTLLGAITAGAAFLFLATQHTVAGIALGWCLAQLALNAMQAALTAGVPDRVPVHQRGEVSGWVGIPQSLGIVLAVVLVTMVATTVSSGHVLIGLLIPLCALPFVLGTPDPVLTAKPARSPFWINPRRHPDFAWAWITRFLMQLGNAMATLYLLYFLTDAVGYERLFPGQQASDDQHRELGPAGARAGRGRSHRGGPGRVSGALSHLGRAGAAGGRRWSGRSSPCRDPASAGRSGRTRPRPERSVRSPPTTSLKLWSYPLATR
ncbi:hypothetical protein Acor_05930 [Acrocarpospora corrugata]|uniref:Major facilitator superfamily (MFS) profile domain-containing protein n=1 Tax=Acrocarpospora corrugata TaxID=35763 RepID=A0A5M3VSD3_9ACTN|nr:MFS transporter [Acrocarpospora corrugata]GER98531.1 hypothetical protein Acor_05930 [Acrocarpospora corrugata]